MKKYHNVVFVLLVSVLLATTAHSKAFAWDQWDRNDPVTDEWKVFDVVIARPLGIAAGILGTGIFILALPYTLPTGGVDEAAETFIKRPFKFTFTRPCPDEDM